MEDDIEMMAMQEMMGGGGGMPPMGGGQPPAAPTEAGMDPNGMTEIPVPNFAVPAVLELIEILQSEMMGAGTDQMSGGMPPTM